MLDDGGDLGALFGRKIRGASRCALTCGGTVLLAGGLGRSGSHFFGTRATLFISLGRGFAFYVALSAGLDVCCGASRSALVDRLALAGIGCFRRLADRVRGLFRTGLLLAWLHGRGYLFCGGVLLRGRGARRRLVVLHALRRNGACTQQQYRRRGG